MIELKKRTHNEIQLHFKVSMAVLWQSFYYENSELTAIAQYIIR